MVVKQHQFTWEVSPLQTGDFTCGVGCATQSPKYEIFTHTNLDKISIFGIYRACLLLSSDNIKEKLSDYNWFCTITGICKHAPLMYWSSIILRMGVDPYFLSFVYFL